MLLNSNYNFSKYRCLVVFLSGYITLKTLVKHISMFKITRHSVIEF